MQLVSEIPEQDFYSVVKDNHGAKAYIYLNSDDNHEIIYKDNTGTEFFREEYKDCLIELVEYAAIDWAYGLRNLA